MFRVSVIYRDEPGKQFDSEYYLGSHARLVKEKLSPLGLLRFEVDGGAGQPPAFPIKADMLFESAEAFESAIEPDGSGRTLSLRDVAGDNAIAASWAASVSVAGTPGQANHVPEIGSAFRFTSVSVAPDGAVMLVLPTAAGLLYSIQKSADLVNWTDWKQAAGSGAAQQFIDDEVSSHSHSFYRAVESEP